MATPVTRYAKSGDVHVAYQVFGSGSIDLVFAPGFISQIEHYWDHPDLARWLLRLGSFARVVIFDKRGTGLSDPVPEVPSLEQRMDDVRAVMDTVGIESAAQLGISEGGALATLFAATYPERCQRLVLYGAFARSPITTDAVRPYLKYIDRDWGSGRSLPIWAPSRRDDPTLQQWWGRFERLGASPSAAMAVVQMAFQIDISDILSSVHVPTLIIHCTGDTLIHVDCGRFLAQHIPGARLIELPGEITFSSSMRRLVIASRNSSPDPSRWQKATVSLRPFCSQTLWARPHGRRRWVTSAGTICSPLITRRCDVNSCVTGAAKLDRLEMDFSPLSTVRLVPYVARARFPRLFARSTFRFVVACIPARSKLPATMYKASPCTLPRASPRSPKPARYWCQGPSRIWSPGRVCTSRSGENTRSRDSKSRWNSTPLRIDTVLPSLLLGPKLT